MPFLFGIHVLDTGLELRFGVQVWIQVKGLEFGIQVWDSGFIFSWGFQG